MHYAPDGTPGISGGTELEWNEGKGGIKRKSAFSSCVTMFILFWAAFRVIIMQPQFHSGVYVHMAHFHHGPCTESNHIYDMYSYASVS
jgi:hypothetical protein